MSKKKNNITRKIKARKIRDEILGDWLDEEGLADAAIKIFAPVADRAFKAFFDEGASLELNDDGMIYLKDNESWQRLIGQPLHALVSEAIDSCDDKLVLGQLENLFQDQADRFHKAAETLESPAKKESPPVAKRKSPKFSGFVFDLDSSGKITVETPSGNRDSTSIQELIHVYLQELKRGRNDSTGESITYSVSALDSLASLAWLLEREALKISRAVAAARGQIPPPFVMKHPPPRPVTLVTNAARMPMRSAAEAANMALQMITQGIEQCGMKPLQISEMGEERWSAATGTTEDLAKLAATTEETEQ